MQTTGVHRKKRNTVLNSTLMVSHKLMIMFYP